jgi:hypothetical protein
MRGGYVNAQEAYDTQYKNNDYLDNQNKKEKRTGQGNDAHYKTTQTYGYSTSGTLNLKILGNDS